MSWDYLNEAQRREAREVAKAYHTMHPRTLPSYAWLRSHYALAAEMPHNTLIAFGRAVLDECKRLMAQRRTA